MNQLKLKVKMEKQIKPIKIIKRSLDYNNKY